MGEKVVGDYVDVYDAADMTSCGMSVVGSKGPMVTLVTLEEMGEDELEDPPEVEFASVHKEQPRKVPRPFLRLVAVSKSEGA